VTTFVRNQVEVVNAFQQIRSVLAVPAAYNLWWNAVGGPALATVVVRDYLKPAVGGRVMEIGCGPGMIVDYLPQVQYLGFDLSPEYIEMARKRFPQAQFVCERVSQFSLAEQQSFDAVVAFGVVHHLDDREARQLFQVAHDALKPGGKLVTVDGVWTDDQSRAARWLLARDRGEYIRSQAEYVKIASQVFSNVRASVRHDLIRIPYSHLILECIR
jgi:cyclopropane fatty-acyl-phospholipid synthase-like methyltransferase